jgi:hypothetical protein
MIKFGCVSSLMQVMQVTCALCRILHKNHMFQIPIADGGDPSVLSGYVCMRVYVRMTSDALDLIEFLLRFSHAHTNSHEFILVHGKIVHLVRWGIIPHRKST